MLSSINKPVTIGIAGSFFFMAISLVASETARTITGTVRDAENRGLENASVYCWNEDSVTGRTTTDAEGRFTLKHPSDRPLQYVFAIKPGLGLDYVFTDETPGLVERQEYGEPGDPEARKQTDGPFHLTLGPARTVKIRILDPEGRPLENVRVSPLMEKKEGWVYDWLYRFKKPDEKNMLLFPSDESITELVNTTGPDGWIEFDWYPEWACDRHVRIVAVDTVRPPRFLRKEIHYLPRTLRPEIVDEVFMVMERAVPVSGVIRLPDGTPMTDCEITRLYRRQYGLAAKTDEQGRFVFYLPPHVTLGMGLDTKPVNGEFWTLPELQGMKTGETGITDLNLTLEKAGRVYSRVTMGKDKVPIEGGPIHYWIMKIEDTSKIRSTTSYSGTIENDLFERILPPGKYTISLRIREQNAKNEFEIKENEDRAIDLHFAKLESIKRRAVTLRTVLDEAGEFTVPECRLWFRSDRTGPFHLSNEIERHSDENGSYRLSAMNSPFFVKALTRDGKFGKLQRIGPDQQSVHIVLEPTSTLKLRCVDADRKPVPGLLLRCSVRRAGTGPYDSPGLFSENTKTDNNGEIEFTGVAGGERDFMYALFTRDDLRRDQVSSMMLLPSWKPVPGETEQRTEEVKPNYSGKDEFFQVFFNRHIDVVGPSPLEQRFPTFLSAARIDGRIPFALFLSMESPKLKERIDRFFTIVYEDKELSAAYERHTLLGVRTDSKAWYPDEPACIVEARDFARRHGIDPETIAEPTVCLFDTQGNCLETKRLEDFYSIGTDPETKEESVIVNRDVFFRFFKP